VIQGGEREEGEDRGERERERASLAWLAAPRCVRVPGPFRQAPAQQGSRDNQAAPDPMHRDGWR